MALTTIRMGMLSISNICSGSSIYSICNKMIRTTSCMRCTINYICSPISRIKYTNPAAIQSVYLYGQRHRGGGCHKPLLPGQIGLEEGKVSTSRGGRCCVEHFVEAHNPAMDPWLFKTVSSSGFWAPYPKIFPVNPLVTSSKSPIKDLLKSCPTFGCFSDRVYKYGKIN
jgi:hypothetical protein